MATPIDARHATRNLRGDRLLDPTPLTHYIVSLGPNQKPESDMLSRISGRDRMIDDVYNARILEFAANIPRLGRLPSPDATATAHSRLCGSTVTIDLAMQDGVVTDFAHDVKACALGQASSSIMARNIVGASADELRAVRETMLRMLKENGPPPEGRFADLKFLEPVRDYKARHASTMLTFDAVVDAIGQIEKKRAEAAA
jgi:NifU-like protein involved in Fe-S cluster formation